MVVAKSGTFDCARCRPATQRDRGCSRFEYNPRPPAAPFEVAMPDGSRREFWDCPVNEIPPRLTTYLRMYAHHRAGHPFYGPTPAKWPMRYLRAMEVIGSEVTSLEAAKRETDSMMRKTAAGRNLMRGVA